MTQALVVYPSGPAFDLEYYLKSHMPLVSSLWTPLGLQSWEVLTFPSDAPYQVQATLHWKSADDFNAAATGESAEKVFGDIVNFTTAKPIVLKGEVVGSSKL
ncbi:hypothetical protein FZEAL_470 [Fusarium zealandicum]|uniref:Ethyl tert-butyl ether degradation n=1 Tax=Fusarium zealandicum TaxID=1053134 RepID=A0A8H4XQE3_9HYPO|nr:hypothetical protein FZEAL_470 [Fusarium zealandicum]